MVPDYNFYINIYYGSKLNENNINKYISKGLSIISSYTMDRVRENTIDKFPEPLSINIKKCACDLADFMFDVDNINNQAINSIVGDDSNKVNNILSSKKAGEVTITYNNNLIDKSINNYLNYKTIRSRYISIINMYLYPQYINGQYYNLLSWIG